MPEEAHEAQQVELEQAWIGLDDLPVHFANAFTGVVGPNAIFLNVGSQVPPAITSEEELSQLRSGGYVAVKPIARLALAPQGLDELIEALETTRRNHQALLKVIKDQGYQS